MGPSELTRRRLERRRKPGLPMPLSSLGSGEVNLGGKQNQSGDRISCRGHRGRCCGPALTPDRNPNTERDSRTCCETAKAFMARIMKELPL